jgi:hypothetical protein
MWRKTESKRVRFGEPLAGNQQRPKHVTEIAAVAVLADRE